MISSAALERYVPIDTLTHIVSVAIPLLLVFIASNIVLSLLSRAAMRRGVKPEHAQRIRRAIRLLRSLLAAALVVIGISSYVGSWTGLGVSVGVLVAAAGFALQRPAASLAAWLIILLKKPFAIGDRIAVGTLARGIVLDVTFTHTQLAEVGRYGAEDVSGRTVLLPNMIIFEQPIIRYGAPKDLIAGEVEFTITHDSNLAKARSIAEKVAADILGPTGQPATRVAISQKGVLVELRYKVPVSQAPITSDISAALLEAYRKVKDIQFIESDSNT